MPNLKWFENAKPTCSIVLLRRFVTESVFALKSGGYGCMFALNGIDDEGLTDEIIEDWPQSSACYQELARERPIVSIVR